jgi:hypothetical protein
MQANPSQRGSSNAVRSLGMLLTLLALACTTSALPPPGRAVGPGYREPCEHGRCADGLSCRYVDPATKREPYCDLETGRCGFDGDCGHGRSCQRLGAELGVCSERGH